MFQIIMSFFVFFLRNAQVSHDSLSSGRGRERKRRGLMTEMRLNSSGENMRWKLST